jgi:hypothetical protein
VSIPLRRGAGLSEEVLRVRVRNPLRWWARRHPSEGLLPGWALTAHALCTASEELTTQYTTENTKIS